jgi:hypothetical protein
MAALTGEMPKRRTHMPPVVTAPPPRPKAAEVKAAENVEQEAPAWAELVSAMGQPVNVKQPKGGRVYGMR